VEHFFCSAPGMDASSNMSASPKWFHEGVKERAVHFAGG
jgi:hypothetical protein